MQIPQLSVAVLQLATFAAALLTMWSFSRRAGSLVVPIPQVRRMALYVAAGVVGEALMLWAGGFWG